MQKLLVFVFNFSNYMCTFSPHPLSEMFYSYYKFLLITAINIVLQNINIFFPFSPVNTLTCFQLCQQTKRANCFYPLFFVLIFHVCLVIMLTYLKLSWCKNVITLQLFFFCCFKVFEKRSNPILPFLLYKLRHLQSFIYSLKCCVWSFLSTTDKQLYQ